MDARFFDKAAIQRALDWADAAVAPRKPQPVDPGSLLTRLLALYWMGGVTQAKAAKLVGIRRDEFMELADLRRCALIIEAAAWRYYLRAFNGCFPDCDRQLAYRHASDARGFERRMYSDEDLLAVPNRDRKSGPVK